MKYECIICNYGSKIKCNYQKHLKTKKHIKNSKKNISTKHFSCECGKTYKYHSGLWRHNKICEIKNKMNTLENKIIKMEKNTNILTNELIKSNKNNSDIINEIKKLKGVTSHTITQNISINVFLNKHCKNAMNLTDFVEKLQVTFEDIMYTGQTNYVEGISQILIKNLNKMNKLERPIHCSDIKRNILYIKNKKGWEKDPKHNNIKKCIKDVEMKQIQKIPEWTKDKNINIYKNGKEGMEYQMVVFNSMGGMNSGKREKNKSSVIKKLCETTDFKL